MNISVVLITGGTQLQAFRNTHQTSHGRTSPVVMSHGSKVHVTVVATNGAGISNVFYSQPVTVDFTPPRICCLTVSNTLLILISNYNWLQFISIKTKRQ